MTRQPLTIEFVDISQLRPYPKNARTHSKRQVRQIADSIKTFGFTNPVLISDDKEIIAGHGRVEAAKLLAMGSVPAVRLSHLNAAQRKAYVIADNKLALNAGWDREVLAIELQALVDLNFDVEITGFSLAEVDLVLDEARDASPEPRMIPMRRSRRSAILAWPRHGRQTSGFSAGIACCAATRVAARPSIVSSAARLSTSSSLTLPIMCRLTDMCAGLAASATASSAWGPARCRGRPLHVSVS
jgi:hypothetical protein